MTFDADESATGSIKLINELIGPGRMFEMTLQGLEDAMKELSR